MSDDSGKSKKLSLSGNRLTLGGLEAGQLRATPGGAGRRTVQVEVRRKRAPAAPHRATTQKAEPVAAPPQAAPEAAPEAGAEDRLTAQERAARVRALQEGMKKPEADAPAGDASEAAVETAADDVGAVAAEARAAEPAVETPAEPLSPAEARRAAELAELKEI
ncbi:MAG: translation initiation factor IF-2 associated domain-containing protein, partial [Pseudomonadota bacterium]|nr:translation initiation factor IF-2 associated domain-containing protein [Pseudomonadota bacterium]